MEKRRSGDKLVWGVILILLALALFLSNLDISIWDAVARLWPVVLIIWGAWKLYFGLKERQEALENQQDLK
ncbi:MAG: LiaI-LiaF-like domain-containing protein [Candidatus Aminicenantales bacterium]